ncbi:MAG: hypothetical protein WBP81_00280 [Solirubrobacteraceae bacterium]
MSGYCLQRGISGLHAHNAELLSPSALNTFGLVSDVRSYVDRMEKAVEVFAQVLQRDPTSAVTLDNLAVAKAHLTGVAAAQEEITAARTSLFGLDQDDLHRCYGLGGLAAIEAEDDEAFRHLARAIGLNREAATDWVEKNAAWRNLRDDPRFTELLTVTTDS